jgi:type I restriction enzyme S subunit
VTFTDSIQEIVNANRNGLLGKHASWQRVALQDVCQILNGFPFPSDRFSSQRGTPLVRIRDVVRGYTDTNFDGPYDHRYLVNRGDLLVGMDGDFNCASWRSNAALLNQRVCKITPDDRFYAGPFLRYVLQGYLSAIQAQTPSMTVAHLSSRTISDIPLPLPPRAEQDRMPISKLQVLRSNASSAT